MSKSKSKRNNPAHTSTRFTPPRASRRRPWLDGSGQWLPVINIEGAGSGRQLVFDLEQREIRWQPVTRALVNGSAGQEDDLYTAHVELPMGASPQEEFWSSPVFQELYRVVFEESEVLCEDDGNVAVWCSDAALHALRRLSSAAFRWTEAREAEHVHARLIDSTVEAFRNAVLRSGKGGEEVWARIEAGRDPKTGTFPWLHVESVRIA